jgi:hypothetical protein
LIHVKRGARRSAAGHGARRRPGRKTIEMNRALAHIKARAGPAD